MITTQFSLFCKFTRFCLPIMVSLCAFPAFAYASAGVSSGGVSSMFQHAENDVASLQRLHGWIIALIILCVFSFVILCIILYRYRHLMVRHRELCRQVKRNDLFERVVRKSEENASSADEPLQALSLIDRLNKLMADEHLYTDPKTNRESVATRLGTNRTYLINCVHDAYGMTFNEYLTELRLNAALHHFEKGAVHLQEASFSVGFTSYSSFYRAFYKKYGVKPAEYIRYLKRCAEKKAGKQ